MSVGVLRNVPYRSFRCGDHEINIYGDPQGMDRPWELDPIPLLISPSDAAVISPIAAPGGSDDVAYVGSIGAGGIVPDPPVETVPSPLLNKKTSLPAPPVIVSAP